MKRSILGLASTYLYKRKNVVAYYNSLRFPKSPEVVPKGHDT